MKPTHGFWLVFAAIGFDMLMWFVPLPLPFISLLGEIAIGVGALYVSFSKAMELKHRAILFLVGLALVTVPVLWWLEIPFRMGMYFDTWRYLSLIRLGIIGLATLMLGSAVTTRTLHRLLIFAIVLVWGVLMYGGLEALGTLGVIVALLVGLGIVAGFYGIFAYAGWKAGEEDSQRIREGKPPKYAAYFDPNNPYGANWWKKK